MNKADTKKITKMQEGGKLLAGMLKELRKAIRPGLDIYKLEEMFLHMCQEKGVRPSCKGYRVADLPPFPTGLCVGVNSNSVHCYPVKGKLLQEGDLVTVDTVIEYQGYHVDSAFTAGVGDISREDRRFLETTQLASASAIKNAVAGNHVGDIGYAMSSIMEMAGYNVLVDFVGHGIGERMHETPDIPCFGSKGQGMVLREGMTLAIEALACQGDNEVVYLDRYDWQTELADGRKFAIFEHTVLVTKDGPEILTKE